MGKKHKKKHGHGQPSHQTTAPARDDEKLARERDEGNAHDRDVVGKMRAKLKEKHQNHGGEKKPPFFVSALPMPVLGAIIIVPIVLIWLAIPRDLWMLVFGVWLTWVTSKVKSGQEWRGGWTWFAIVVMGVLSLFLFTLLGIIVTVVCALKARKPSEDEDEEEDEDDSDD